MLNSSVLGGTGFFRDLENASPDGHRYFNEFIKCLTSAHTHKARHKFLKDCLAEQILPKSIPKGDNIFDLPFPEQHRLSLRDRILKHGMETGNMFAAVRKARIAYQTFLPATRYGTLYGIACKSADARVKHNKQALSKKLASLIGSSKWSRITDTSRVLNLSGQEVDENVLRVLSLGLGFALKPTASTILKAIAKIHRTTSAFPQRAENEQLRGAIWSTALKLLRSSTTLPRRFTVALNFIRKQTGLAIMPSDKSGHAVILNWADYIRSGELLLSDTTTYKPRNKGDSPLDSMITSYNRGMAEIINSLPANNEYIKTLKGFTISDRSRQNVGYAYFLPKTHKDYPPLQYRPIVAQCNSVIAPLSKYVASLLTPLAGKFSPAHLKNSYEFKERLTSFYANNPNMLMKPMVSLDVTQLFTNVDVPLVLGFLKQKFEAQAFTLPDGMHIDTLIKLVGICCKHTVFKFNSKYYEQTRGCSMGSPLSVILANLAMEAMETEFMPMIPITLAFYSRFIDDCFCVWEHTRAEFEAYVSHLNKLIPSINFTYEWEVFDPSSREATLPFLDLLVHRRSTGPQFSIYRKPTHALTYIHYLSQHPPSQKQGVMIGLFLRAIRLSSPAFLEQEFQTLSQTFSRLCYPNFEVRRALSIAKTKHLASPSSTNTNTSGSRLIALPFPYQSDLLPLNHVIRDSGFKFVFTARNTLGKNVVSKRGLDAASSHQSSGVYIIECNFTGCHQHYYGRSLQFSKRTTQHKRDYDSRDHTKPLWKHCIEYPGHTFTPSNARILWHTRNLYMSQLVEAACINSFHSCNKAPPEVTISDTFSAFVTSMAGIRGRRKWQEPIEHPHTDSTQVNSVDANVDLQVTNAPALQPATDGVGSAEVSTLLGIPQQTSSVSINHDVTLDLGSDPYRLQGSQASGLEQMPVDPMSGSPDPSILNDTDPLNLAFLDVAINHSQSMADGIIQESPSTSTLPPDRKGRLTRQQLLIQEAREGFH